MTGESSVHVPHASLVNRLTDIVVVERVCGYFRDLNRFSYPMICQWHYMRPSG